MTITIEQHWQSTGVRTGAWTEEDVAVLERWRTAGEGRALFMVAPEGTDTAACIAYVDGIAVGSWHRTASRCSESDAASSVVRRAASLADLLNPDAAAEPVTHHEGEDAEEDYRAIGWGPAPWTLDERAALEAWRDRQRRNGSNVFLVDFAAERADDGSEVPGGSVVWIDGRQVGMFIKPAGQCAALDYLGRVSRTDANLPALLADAWDFPEIPRIPRP